jgi:hypothetical protein
MTRTSMHSNVFMDGAALDFQSVSEPGQSSPNPECEEDRGSFRSGGPEARKVL